MDGCLTEPESAFSFTGCLSLTAALKDLLAAGNSQVVMSTRSPFWRLSPVLKFWKLDSGAYVPANGMIWIS